MCSMTMEAGRAGSCFVRMFVELGGSMFFGDDGADSRLAFLMGRSSVSPLDGIDCDGARCLLGTWIPSSDKERETRRVL